MLQGQRRAFVGALAVRAELLGEDVLVLLHEVGGGLDEGVADLPGVLLDELLDVAVHAHPPLQGALPRGLGGRLVHPDVQLSLGHLTTLARVR